VTLRHKLRVSVILLSCIHAVILFAGFVAPYDFATQYREYPFAPPTRLHFVDEQGRFHFRPFVFALPESADEASGRRTDTIARYTLDFFVPGTPYKLAGILPAQRHLFGVSSPGKIFLLGTDEYGRDQFSRFLYGGQISLLSGLLGASFSVLLGLAIGSVAGFYSGWIDDALMRVTELFLACPWLYLLFAVRAALPLHLPEWQVFILLVAVLGLVGWARPARLIRGLVLSAKERNFVLASRGFGSSDFHLLFRHVLPQTYGLALTQMTLLIPQYVLAEVTLSFLGLGVGEPMPSWGSLLSYSQHYYILESYWWMFIPALLLLPTFLAYKALSDALLEHIKSVPL
jgi:peptide/nickel transport system permease protein